jgi:diaminopimelate epimerase
MAVAEHVVRLEATGNRFALLDALEHEPPADLPALARRVCRAETAPLDGLLVVGRSDRGADVRMIVFNADGGRPESCGNGLRCVAKLARERGHVRSDEMRIETDAGLRRVTVSREGGRVRWAEAALGVPHVMSLDERLLVDGRELSCSTVDLGNPHCVLFVEELAELEALALERLGPQVERHPRFPSGTNVELVVARERGVAMRVWERGVGETASCGTGAAAATAVALATGRGRSPLAVETRGGTLTVRQERAGTEIFVGGAVGELG